MNTDASVDTRGEARREVRLVTNLNTWKEFEWKVMTRYFQTPPTLAKWENMDQLHSYCLCVTSCFWFILWIFETRWKLDKEKCVVWKSFCAAISCSEKEKPAVILRGILWGDEGFITKEKWKGSWMIWRHLSAASACLMFSFWSLNLNSPGFTSPLFNFDPNRESVPVLLKSCHPV